MERGLLKKFYVGLSTQKDLFSNFFYLSGTDADAGKTVSGMAECIFFRSHLSTYVFISFKTGLTSCLCTLCFITTIPSLNNTFVCSCSGASGLVQLFF